MIDAFDPGTCENCVDELDVEVEVTSLRSLEARAPDHVTCTERAWTNALVEDSAAICIIAVLRIIIQVLPG